MLGKSAEARGAELLPIAAIFAVAALGMLAVFSSCSFLFLLQEWVDDNLFLTIGRAIMRGAVLYVDAFDHKGLYLYLLYGVAAELNGLFPVQNPFFVMYLFEAAAATVYMLYLYRIARLYLEDVRLCGGIALLSGFLTYQSDAMYTGGSVEEFVLPLVVYGLYHGLLLARRGALQEIGTFFRSGMLAGLVLWSKFTLLGFWIGWCAYFGVLTWKRSGFAAALSRMLAVLCGMALVSVPVFVYFALNGALGAMFRSYFYFNLVLYPSSHTLAERFAGWASILCGMANGLAPSYVLAALLLLAGGCYAGMRGSDASVFAFAGSMWFFVYVGGVTLFYYYLPFYAFSALGLVAAAKLIFFVWERLPRRVPRMQRCVRFSASVAAFLCLIGGAACGAAYALDKGFVREYRLYYAPYSLAERMEGENPTLLCYYDYDRGLYALTDTLPFNKYYCLVNVPYEKFPELYEEQKSLVAAGIPDYVTVCEFNLPDAQARALLEERYEFVTSARTLRGEVVQLWQRKAEETPRKAN